MRRWRRLLRGVALIAAMGGGVFAGSIVAWSESQATSDEFQQAVLPVLAKNCFGCHSDRLHTGDLSLEPFRDVSLAPQETRHLAKGPCEAHGRTDAVSPDGAVVCG